jgi:predicted dehydrogenase
VTSALSIARSHVEAWSSHDFDTARSLLAPAVKVTATSTDPALPETALTGVDDDMRGLIAFADPIVPGSLQVIGSVGDERNALLMLTAQLSGGPMSAKATLSGARLYLLDDNRKIKTERVILCLTPE